jgi:hypothetical protein
LVPHDADTGLAVVSVNPLAELSNTYWKLLSLNEIDVAMAEEQKKGAFLQLRAGMDTESGFMQVLDGTAYFSIHEETLTLLNAQRQPVARFKAMYFN